MSPRIKIQVGNIAYPYWSEFSISKRIDAISSRFDLSLADSRALDLFEYPITAGDKAVLSLENQAVISGYIDTLKSSFSNNELAISITGRDNSSDLVDCSTLLSTGELLNLSLYEIAVCLSNPFDIGVLPGVDSSPIQSFKIDPGETAFEALERAARYKGLLVRPDGLGNIYFAKIGQRRSSTPLVQGKNIESAEASYDNTDRFAQYIVRGQNMLPEDPYESTEEEAQGESNEIEEIEGSALDKGVRKTRSNLQIANTSITATEAKNLAAWEAIVRASRALSVRIETSGFTKDDGLLWDVNELIRINSKALGIDAYLLSTGVDFRFSKDKGPRTTIELTRIDAFQPKPEIEPE